VRAERKLEISGLRLDSQSSYTKIDGRMIFGFTKGMGVEFKGNRWT